MASRVHDVIVIGGGAVGLGATYEVAKSGASVLVLEQNQFFNQAGSSGDLARMYRTMYTEPFMADIAKDSLAIWDDLEKDAGTTLRAMTGLLNFGDPSLKYGPEGTLKDPIKNLDRLGMRYDLLTKDQIEARYPFKNLPDYFEGVFAYDNGIINVPLMLRTLFRLAEDYGAHALQNTEVKKVVPEEQDGQQIWKVETLSENGQGTEFRARKLIITSGAFTNHVLEPSFDLQLKLNIWEMTASYFASKPDPEGTVFPSMWFQFEKDEGNRSQLMYGFPTLEWGPPNLCRISVDAATLQIKDPNQRSPSTIHAGDLADVQKFIKNHTRGVDSTVPASALVCLMTNVDDNMFVLDYVPEKYLKGGPKDSVVVFTAGWAMKFVPLLGQALKDMALKGGSKFALKEFKIDRPGIIYDPSSDSLTAKISSFALGGFPKQASGSSVHGGSVPT